MGSNFEPEAHGPIRSAVKILARDPPLWSKKNKMKKKKMTTRRRRRRRRRWWSEFRNGPLGNISFRKITGLKRLPMYKTNIVNSALYLTTPSTLRGLDPTHQLRDNNPLPPSKFLSLLYINGTHTMRSTSVFVN